MPEARVPRKLAAILAADVVGYSHLMELDEAGTLAALKAHHAELIDPTITEHQGRIVKLMGDGVLVEFASVVDALACAIDIQRGMQERNQDVPTEQRIEFRMGINLGDVIVEGDDLYGDGVNVAARLEGLAEPGGICISEAVHTAVGNKLSVGFADIGEQQVKNIEKPVRVYRVLIAPEAAGKAVSQTRPRKARSRRWLAAISGLIVLVAMTGIVLWQQPWRTAVAPVAVEGIVHPLPDKPSIAVLPFNNLSDDREQEYFADGLTDDLIIDLSKISGLFVIARNSVFTFKGKPVRIKNVAQELGVRYVVEGSLRRAGGRLRVNAQLIDGATGHRVWGERYDREITDLFAVQDELVGQIVAALAVRLTQSEAAQLTRRATPEFEAYELYLQARDGYFSGDDSRMRESLDLYEQAWTVDPTYARAYAGYARAAADVWRLRSNRVMGGPLARQAAEDAAHKALALDPNIPDAHSVLALIKMVERDHDGAVESARVAVELDPNSADAHTALAVVLGYAGRPEASLDSIRAAVRLDPRPPVNVWTYYGWAYFLNRDYEKVIEVLEPIAETPSHLLGDAPREILAMAYAQIGRLDEARAQVQALREPEPFLNLGWYRLLYAHHARDMDLEHRLEALRKAGMPEWPLDFRGDDMQRLDERSLQNLISSKTWSGTDAARGALPFIQEFGKDGGAVYASATTIMSGNAFIKRDELCERFDVTGLGRDLCGPVYRIPPGMSKNGKDYAYVNPITVRYFSLQEQAD